MSLLKSTQICGFNLESNVVENLKEKGIQVFNGSLGNITQINYSRLQSTYAECLTGLIVPKNFHEYEMAIFDLSNEKVVDYDLRIHKRNTIEDEENRCLYCLHPQNIFDPRPLSLFSIMEELNSNLQKGFLTVCFCGSNKNISYRSDASQHSEPYYVSLYRSFPMMAEIIEREGNRLEIANYNSDMSRFLGKYKKDMSYKVLFELPKINNDSEYINDPNFVPTVYNNDSEVAGFYHLFGNSAMFFFPKVMNQVDFLDDFIKNVAPTFVPHLFPELVKGSWLNQERYFVPDQQKLIKEREKLEIEYRDKLLAKNSEIQENDDKYSFLKEMLIQTDTPLVKAVIQFLKFIGFENAIDADAANSKIKEEDIQIETDNGLIVIEVKGIGGTSKDEECSQIGKIKARRERERNSFDVYALYVVNHERHKPAESRNNPPFTEYQIQDAEYNRRGLITTWQLFNLYFAIHNGILTKEQVKEAFYKYGYLDFIPESSKLLGTPSEFYNNNKIIVIDVPKDVVVRRNDYLLIKIGEEFRRAGILSIQIDGVDVESCNGKEAGLKLDASIPGKSILYTIDHSALSV